MTCIYGILNKLTGQYYVGSSVNFNKRKKLHLERLTNKNHHSYLLQKEWSKHPEYFEFIILEKVSDKKDLLQREQWWIDNTDSYYNICKIANSSSGVKRTEETKEKIRSANLGLKHPEWRNEIKSQAQGGDNHWTKKKNFSEESKLKMSESQKELYKKGYINPRKGKKETKEQIKLKTAQSSKPILQYDMETNLIKEWNSIKEATKFGFLSKYIIECCKNKRNKYKNFIWKYKRKTEL